MINNFNIKILNVLLLPILFSLQACTSLQAFPGAARAGDTISFAVGSAEGMTKDPTNTTAVYVPDAGGSYPLTIRSVFNLYPDKKSSLYQSDSATTFVIDTSNHEAWQTVMVVDLPVDVPVGTGNLHITSTATLPTISSQINNVPIAMEIIAGVGEPNDFTYEFGFGASRQGNLSLLEPLPHALVIPPTDNETYGAIEMKIILPNSAAVNRPLTEAEVKVVVDDMTPSTLSNRNVVWRYDGDELLIMLMSPSGSLLAMESRFSIVLAPRVSFTGAPVISELNFYDWNGVSVPGPLIADYTITLN